VIATAGPALRLAHRGDWRVAPENTIPAFLAALDIPACDGIELDVRLSRDGVPVILHDEGLSRVQRVHERVDRLTADELAGHGVPRLDGALAAIDGHGRAPEPFLDVELKGDDHGPATADVLRAARGIAPARAVVSSFDGASLATMAGLLPGWPRWLNASDLSAGTLSLAVGLGCRAVSAIWGDITPTGIAAAGEAGLQVAAWTVRRPATVERLGLEGVVAVCVEGAALGPVAGGNR
jgi:glycerophosphoryl diester phosphodiesterase